MPVRSECLRQSLEGRYAKSSCSPRSPRLMHRCLGGAFCDDAYWAYPSTGANVDRYWHGARLYHAGRAPRVIVSGGRHPARRDNPSEAESGARFLVDMGVPAGALLLEKLAMNTHDHVRFISRDTG